MSHTVTDVADVTVDASTRNLFRPLLLLSIAIVGWFGFQAWQLSVERVQLLAIIDGQQAQVDAAAKVRTSLDALAASTQRLADSGNSNASLIVEELRKRGVTINPDATPTAPAPSAPR